jgi:hypothetical protein
LPADRPNNRPFYEAVEGLERSLEALGLRGDSEALRKLKEQLSGGRAAGGGGASGRPDPLV